MIRQYISRQFAVFLLTGGIAAAVNFSSRIVFSRYTCYQAAIVLACIVGMITAFILARVFVFTESSQKIHRSAIYFVLVNLLALAQTWMVSIGLAFYVLPYLGVRDYAHEIAHAVGIVIPVFTSYIGHKRFSFA
ncbi:MAG: GtrA family protein [Chlorobium limicola]|uniref:GtrA family protein n=1 Tax=Chlorobium limicola TaxID=1092 RepID=UPI0023F0CD17|nr:GtrA family protein [Chlorobium limicola]NTV21839.1 GtrA family protein [Chlorobium limicola]NTV98194.1 GtrA family protein [Chlorobiaceae bacterium]